jgi:penicillin-binding protein 1C
MEELAQLYAILPNQGEWHEIQYLKNSKIDEKQSFRLLSSEASFIVLDMLRQTTRPDTYSVARPAIAWKTGTSWGFRDAWTAGVFGRYVLVVWVGNFDGASNPALIGVEAAAPPFLRIVDAIRAEKLDAGETIFTQPPDLKRIEVCAASGDLPNKECPVKTQAWFIAGKSPIKQSTLHRSVLIDSRTGKMACQPNAFTHTEVYEYWPSDMQNLFKRAGMSLRQPPIDVCGAMNGLESADRALSITSPLRSVTHLTRLDRKEPILLRAEAGANSGNLHWFVNNALLGQAKPGETISWYPSQVGKYMLRVVDADGRADSREVTIELVN